VRMLKRAAFIPTTAGSKTSMKSGSPAIDSGTNTGCPSFDLDGTARPKDGNGDSTATCDMGAYEAGTIFNITLDIGWNMISSYIDPDDPDMAAVFAPIVADMELVKNSVGQVYWPSLPLNQIGNWNVNEGYLVYMNNPQTLTITGTQMIPEGTPLNLAQGWNMITYLRDTPLDIAVALADLSDTIVLAKNVAGQVYWPSLPLNQIGDMLPGQGYLVYLSAPDTLTYPNND